MDERQNGNSGREVSAFVARESYNLGLTYTVCASGVDAAIKMRPRANELGEIGQEFEARWNDFFENAPDKPVVWMKGSPR